LHSGGFHHLFSELNRRLHVPQLSWCFLCQ
jgi:hypothetical protein